jgi:serine/threonine protein kinase
MSSQGIGIGSHLGGYEIQAVEGRGAMGLVYRAYHEGLDRTVAVKMLQAVAPDPEAVKRFRQEARAIARLRHQHIVNVHDFGEVDGVPYMIEEYVPGGSLAARLREGKPLSRDESIEILSEMADALDYAHGRGILHRDVKPANILLREDGEAVLADFGLAKLVQSSLQTMPGVSTGTPTYMAPEQARAQSPCPETDQYALAVISYQLLCGTVPFAADEVLQVMFAHVHEIPAPPSGHEPSLSPAVDEVILRGLAKVPQERWENCRALTRALDRAWPAAAPTVTVTADETVAWIPPVEEQSPIEPTDDQTAAPVVEQSLVAEAAPPSEPSRVVVEQDTRPPVVPAAADKLPPPGAGVAPKPARMSPSPPRSASAQPNFRYAGFWRRLAAFAIDALILTVVLFIVAIPAAVMSPHSPPGWYVVVLFGLPVIYGIAFIARSGRTPGMKRLGIQVTKDGESGGVGVRTAFGRYLASILSSLALWIGFLAIAWHPEKRAWHDSIAGTWVVHSNSVVGPASFSTPPRQGQEHVSPDGNWLWDGKEWQPVRR